jgi:predicted metal-binding protein
MSVRREQMIDVQEICRTRGVHSPISISQDILEEIERLAKELGFTEVHLIHTSKIVVARWVGLKCRYGCAKYNTNWCCPPAAPELEAIRELLAEYDLALLLIRECNNEQFYRNTNDKRRFQIKQWKSTIALERKLFLMGYYKAFGFPADTCALCKQCAYPEQCKFPNEKRPSLESCSIDVFQTLKRVGKTVGLARNVNDTYYSYSLILLL